ncbi:MFS transporter [Ramlibacter sp. G-1-2-2]|uniref:MFS transporter n=1 Tax=Ramlibacter agri TaxID=2728837 RepID=A0A848GVW7_9BURK|nr:MFS transporter [Ramlibacter agri]NML42267.1 MFS transporter [Ramlibacter agri]
MFAPFVSRRLQRHGIHYAWVVMALTFLAMLVTSAALGLPGAMLQPLSQEFGWTTEQLSSVFAVRFALFGLLGPFAAVFIMRFGLRRVVAIALTIIGFTIGLATQVTQLWQLFLLWGLLLGFGSGTVAMVLGAIVANRWFTERRGLVMGLLAGSTATGQLIFLPVAAWLIEHLGWRYAVLPVCIAAAAVVVLISLLMKDNPADLGLRPYGEAAGAAAPAAAPVPLGFTGPFKVLAEASRNRTFWILAGTFFVCGLSTNGLLQTHFISLCGDRGLGPVPAASVLSMMGVFDLFGTTLSGYLSDRYDNRKLLMAYYGLRGLSLLWLPYSDFTLVGLSMFAMFYGLDWIATVPPTVKLSAAEFGKEKAGLVFGWVFAAHQLGAATAAYAAGVIRTVLLTYNPALTAAGLACLLAAIGVLAIRKPAAAAPLAMAPARS